MFFSGIFFSVGKFDGKKILSLTWTEKNILRALYALKKFFLKKRKKCREQKFCFAAKRKKIIAPYPFELNGFPLVSRARRIRQSDIRLTCDRSIYTSASATLICTTAMACHQYTFNTMIVLGVC